MDLISDLRLRFDFDLSPVLPLFGMFYVALRLPFEVRQAIQGEFFDRRLSEFVHATHNKESVASEYFLPSADSKTRSLFFWRLFLCRGVGIDRS